MWILNVGDIKPAEYQVELFLDMAWNLEAVKQQGLLPINVISWSVSLEK